MITQELSKHDLLHLADVGDQTTEAPRDKPCYASISLAQPRAGAYMEQKKSGVAVLRALLRTGAVTPADLREVLPRPVNNNPVELTAALEEWLTAAGLAAVTGQPVRLSSCPFSEAELIDMDRAGLIVCCVPADVDGRDLAIALHLPNWAAGHPLVTRSQANEDDWFATPCTPTPPHVGISAKEADQLLETSSHHALSLMRYLVFTARYRHLYGTPPDQRWWTWLLRTRYDRSGVLIAGLDSTNTLSVHAWMRDFKAKFLGCRYCVLPQRPIGASTLADEGD